MTNTKLSNDLKDFGELSNSWKHEEITESLKGIDERKVYIIRFNHYPSFC